MDTLTVFDDIDRRAASDLKRADWRDVVRSVREHSQRQLASLRHAEAGDRLRVLMDEATSLVNEVKAGYLTPQSDNPARRQCLRPGPPQHPFW